jgi:C4-type Zn-finger protein
MAIMKVHLEDEHGQALPGTEEFRYDLALGTQRFSEIEGVIEQVKQQLGKDMTVALLAQAQAAFNQEKKTIRRINGMGRTRF